MSPEKPLVPPFPKVRDEAAAHLADRHGEFCVECGVPWPCRPAQMLAVLKGQAPVASSIGDDT